MQIKEVEKLTGLTAKSIRYYESKGLITVARNEENSYRDYSHQEVAQLNKIKLFRYLDFTIEEIGQLLNMDDNEIKNTLQEKAESFSDQKNLCENKQDICLALAKDYEKNPQIIEEYNDTIEFLESDEMAETMDKLKDYVCPNLPATIVSTLIFAAPILWLFYNIHAGFTEPLMTNALCAVFCSGMITWNWIHYVTQYKKHKKRIKKLNRQRLWVFPFAILAIIVGLVTIVGLLLFAEKLMAPDNYLFFEHNQLAGTIMIWLIMIPVILLCVILITKIRRKSYEEIEDQIDLLFIWNHLGKWRPVAILIWCIAMYICITNVTFVTENSIICHSPLNPAGTSYQYSDVKSIRTGFGNKNFAICEYKRKGSFFYEITLDGKKIIFHAPSTNENIKRYEEHSYLELEELDQALVALNIPKEGSSDGYENCDFDQEYVDRFVRIIQLR